MTDKVKECKFYDGEYWCQCHKILVNTKTLQKGDGLIACCDVNNCYYKQLRAKEEEVRVLKSKRLNMFEHLEIVQKNRNLKSKLEVAVDALKLSMRKLNEGDEEYMEDYAKNIMSPLSAYDTIDNEFRRRYALQKRITNFMYQALAQIEGE